MTDKNLSEIQTILVVAGLKKIRADNRMIPEDPERPEVALAYGFLDGVINSVIEQTENISPEAHVEFSETLDDSIPGPLLMKLLDAWQERKDALA